MIRRLLVAVALLALAPAATAEKCVFEHPGGRMEYDCGMTEERSSSTAPEAWWASSTAQAVYAVVGLAGSAGAAAYTLHRVRRRRHSLAGYLRTIEEAYALGKSDPHEGARRLVAVRTEVRARFHAGKLDDAHFLELDKRATESVLKLRLLWLDQRYPSLPPALLAQVRTLISDGNVSEADVALLQRALAAHLVPLRAREDVVATLRAWVREDGNESAPVPVTVHEPAAAPGVRP